MLQLQAMDELLQRALPAAVTSFIAGVTVHQANQQEIERLHHECETLRQINHEQTQLIQELVKKGQVTVLHGKTMPCNPLNTLINEYIIKTQYANAITLIKSASQAAGDFDINGIDHRGNTALHVAAKKGAATIIDILLEHHANIDTYNIEGNTPLICAVKEGRIATTQRLLKHKASVIIQDKNDMTPLHHATFLCAPKLVSLLLAISNIKHIINAADTYGKTPLLHAVEKEHLPTVTLLLNANASPNIQDKRGMTPLHYTSQKGNLALTEMLLQYKANINTSNNNGETALTLALQKKHENIIALLLSQNIIHEPGKKKEAIEYRADHILTLRTCEKIEDISKRKEAIHTILKQITQRDPLAECSICYETYQDKCEDESDKKGKKEAKEAHRRFYFSCCYKMICSNCQKTFEQGQDKQCPFCQKDYKLHKNDLILNQK